LLQSKRQNPLLRDKSRVTANTAQPDKTLNHDGLHSNDNKVGWQYQSAASKGSAIAAKANSGDRIRTTRDIAKNTSSGRR
jgi:hypothetical protein